MSLSADHNATPSLRYMPGLDGLRAIAVIAVVLYHGQDVGNVASFLKPQGGFLGVEVFFVISGFLITSLLIREFDQHRSIDLRSFWTRRARRLLPALYVFLAGTVAMAALFGTDAFDKIRKEILGAVFYVSNWLLIATNESYFEAAGRPSLLRHLWSLAIEEQFYLIWPVVVIFGLRFLGRQGLLALTLAGVAGSTALMVWLFDGVEQYGDVTSVYYRTDARAAALLLGSALALLWEPAAGDQDSLSPGARWTADALGAAALALVIAAQYLFTDRVIEWSSYERLYQGGFLALSAATVAVIAAVSSPHSRLGLVLGNPVLRWVGTRSYGIYLWHWPVFALSRPRVDVDIDGYTLLGVRLAITAVLVELSYRLVEAPIRERRFAHGLRALRTPQGIALGTAGAIGLIAATAAVAVAIPSIDRGSQTVASGPETAVVSPAADLPAGASNTAEPIATTLPVPEPEPTTDPALLVDATPQIGEAAPALGQELASLVQPMPEPTPTQTPLPPPPPLSAPFDISTSQIHFVGDSVIEGAQGQLFRISPRVTVDGRIGRQWWEVEAELRQMRSAGLANDVVIIQLGNNGNFNNQMFEGVMSALSGTRLVLFINIHAPVLWEADVNGLLARAVNRYPDQARLIDWYSASIDHPEYFIEDGTHLQGEGQVAFRRLIENTLLNLS